MTSGRASGEIVIGHVDPTWVRATTRMQYMLMIHADETKPLPTGDDLTKLINGYRDFTESIAKSGHLRAGERLHPSSSATTVREKNGKLLSTKGPVADAKTYLAGYYIVECATLDEATAIAGRIPGVRLGEAVEVRPLVPTPQGGRP
jgi:hypothetical protein